MSRQPMLPRFKGLTKPIFGPGQIARKPEFAAAIGRCIMIFSYVDWQMAVLLATLIKADSDGSIAVFLTLRNARAQREVLIAASDGLDENFREIFDALMLIYVSLQAKRADLAHGVFGAIPDVQDQIAWVEAKNLSKHWVEKFHRSKDWSAPQSTPAEDEQLKKNSFTYDLPSLTRLEKDISDFWSHTFTFTLALKYKGFGFDKEFARLKDAPQIRQAVSQNRSGKKTQSPPEQSGHPNGHAE